MGETPSLIIRLYLDADVHVKLASNLRESGYDCISAREVGAATLDDEAQLERATSEARVLLTRNIQHFVPIFERRWFAGLEHAGIVVSSQIPLGELQRRIVRMLSSITADDMRNNIRNLAEFAD